MYIYIIIYILSIIILPLPVYIIQTYLTRYSCKSHEMYRVNEAISVIGRQQDEDTCV